MAHLDIYLAPCPAYGWLGGPEFRTRIVEQRSGDESRLAQWAQERGYYTASFLNIMHDAQRSIARVFRVCRGRAHAFRFVDQLDGEATIQEGVLLLPDGTQAAGNGVTTTFQIGKRYEDEGVYLRRIHAIRLGSAFQVRVNNAPTSVTLDNRTGRVTFSSPPAEGAVLRWSGEFDIWVRFDQDSLPFTIDDRSEGQKVTNGAVNLVEVAPPKVGQP